MEYQLTERERALPRKNGKGYRVVDTYSKALLPTYRAAVAYKKEHGGNIYTYEDWESRERGF
jgi:hypothetical protein